MFFKNRTSNNFMSVLSLPRIGTKALRIMKLVPLLILPLSSPAQAVDLGLTPSHVFATWMNINETLVVLGDALDDKAKISAELKAMEPQAFSGKKPGEVLKQLTVFRDKLDRLASRHGQKATAIFKDPAGGTVTPSVVFMNSGHVLDSTVLLLSKLDGSQLISGFFQRHAVSGKTPDGPYSLVDLANRRIDMLLR